MAVSWDPGFSGSSRTGAGDITVLSPWLASSSGGSGVEVVALAVFGAQTDNGAGTITSLPADMTVLFSQYESGGGDFATRFFLLWRPVSEDDIVIGVSGSAAAVAGFYPMATPLWLHPQAPTVVNGGAPSGNYSNPQVWSNFPGPTITDWMPAPPGDLVAGIVFIATSGGGTLGSIDTLTTTADTDLSATQTITETSGPDTVRVRVGLVALEGSSSDPLLLGINSATSAAERRWLGWAGARRVGRKWWVGVSGWGPASTVTGTYSVDVSAGSTFTASSFAPLYDPTTENGATEDIFLIPTLQSHVAVPNGSTITGISFSFDWVDPSEDDIDVQIFVAGDDTYLVHDVTIPPGATSTGTIVLGAPNNIGTIPLVLTADAAVSVAMFNHSTSQDIVSAGGTLSFNWQR